MNYKIVRGYVIPLQYGPKKRRARKKKPPKAVPPDVLAEIPKNQRGPLREAIRRIGGWNTDRACTWKGPRKTWRNTKEYARQLHNEVEPGGLDTLDPGSVVLQDAFCERLDLKGKKCPASKQFGGSGEGWPKALRIALGSKTRRYAELRDRPQWDAFTDALEQEGKQLHPLELAAFEVHEQAEAECKDGHDAKRAELLADAKRGKLKRRKKEKVPF